MSKVVVVGVPGVVPKIEDIVQVAKGKLRNHLPSKARCRLARAKQKLQSLLSVYSTLTPSTSSG